MSLYKEHTVYYEVFEVTGNAMVDPRNCTSISFELGTNSQNATIEGVIPLDSTHPTREFNNLPGGQIDQRFRIAFTADDANNKVIVVRTFTELKTIWQG